MSKNTSPMHFVSAPCGTGKTTAAVDYIAKHQYEHNYLYVVPTQHLMTSVQEMLRTKGITAHTISSESHPRNVVPSIVEFLKKAPDDGLVLIITLEAYKKLPYFNRRENWQIIIDEIPQVDCCHQFKLPRNMSQISSRLKIDGTINENIARVVAIDPKALRRELEAVMDDVDEMFRELFQRVVSESYDTFIETADWERLVEKEHFSSNEALNEITFVSMLNTDLFQNSVLLGANVEDSLLYHWLRRFHGLQMSTHTEIEEQLRTDIDPVNCQIGFFFEHKNFSKHLYKSIATDSKSFIDLMDEEAVRWFEDDEFLYVLNNDRVSCALDQLPNAIKMPVMSHGSNDYRQYTNIYFSAALNRTPKHLKILKYLGFEMDQVRTSESHDVIYQSVMRTALRNEHCGELVQVLVPDLSTAKRLMSLVAGSEIVKIGTLDQYLKSVVPLTQAQKGQNCRSRKIRTSMVSPKSLPNTSLKGISSQIGKCSIGGQHSSCFVTTHDYTNKLSEQDCNEIKVDIQEWIKNLRSLSKELVDNKDDLKLYCPSTFKSKPDVFSFKCHACFVKASFLVLDFDNGSMSPEDFIKEFGNDQSTTKRRSFLIMNSFSRSEKEPNRFRVIMLFKRPARTVDEYQACFDYIARRLGKAGFPETTSGLDRCSRSPSQSFYFPGTNRSHQDWSFFENHWTKTTELELYAIDPHSVWAMQSPKIKFSEPKMSTGTPSQQKAADTADQLKVVIKGKDEGRHHAQYLLACELKKARFDNDQIAQQLRECLPAGTKTDKKIRDTLQSLDRWPTWH